MQCRSLKTFQFFLFFSRPLDILFICVRIWLSRQLMDVRIPCVALYKASAWTGFSTQFAGGQHWSAWRKTMNRPSNQLKQWKTALPYVLCITNFKVLYFRTHKFWFTLGHLSKKFRPVTNSLAFYSSLWKWISDLDIELLPVFFSGTHSISGSVTVITNSTKPFEIRDA